MNIHVIIPAYNEARSLPALFKRIRKLKNIRCHVVDDGSIDQTYNIAKQQGAIVLRNKKNMGAGRATSLALRRLRVKTREAVILMDADGQHDPKYIRQLVSEVRKGADYVIASRYINKTRRATSVLRIIGTKTISLWLWLWFGRRIFDPTAGYRAMSARAHALFAKQYPPFFSEPSAILIALENGLIIREVPCVMKPRMLGKSSISSVKAILLISYIFVVIPYRAMHRIFNSGLVSGR